MSLKFVSQNGALVVAPDEVECYRATRLQGSRPAVWFLSTDLSDVKTAVLGIYSTEKAAINEVQQMLYLSHHRFGGNYQVAPDEKTLELQSKYCGKVFETEPERPVPCDEDIPDSVYQEVLQRSDPDVMDMTLEDCDFTTPLFNTLRRYFVTSVKQLLYLYSSNGPCLGLPRIRKSYAAQIDGFIRRLRSGDDTAGSLDKSQPVG